MFRFSSFSSNLQTLSQNPCNVLVIFFSSFKNEFKYFNMISVDKFERMSIYAIVLLPNSSGIPRVFSKNLKELILLANAARFTCIYVAI